MSERNTQRASFHKASVFTLSAREREVATGLASNETVGDIAKRLGINASAVSNYRRRAQEKLGLYNRFQLAAFARDQGWLKPPLTPQVWEATPPPFDPDCVYVIPDSST